MCIGTSLRSAFNERAGCDNITFIPCNTIKEMDEWVVKMETIDRYDKESNGYKDFRNKLYNDPDYIKWSDKYCSDNGIKPRKSKDTVNRVLLAGDSWWNWKVGNKRDHTGTLDKTKHEFLNPCFHYFKNIYDKNSFFIKQNSSLGALLGAFLVVVAQKCNT